MNYRELPDMELIARYRDEQSDGVAFDELWRRYEPTARKFAGHLSYMCPHSFSRELFAEDVFSEAQEKVVKRIDQYEGRVTFSSWLWMISERTAIDQRRRRLGRGPQGREFVELSDQDLAQPGAVFWDKVKQNPVHHAMCSERRATLDDIMAHHAASEEGYRSIAAIVFSVLHDYTVREVAELLDTYERKVHRLFAKDYPRLRAALAARGIRSVSDVFTAQE